MWWFNDTAFFLQLFQLGLVGTSWLNALKRSLLNVQLMINKTLVSPICSGGFAAFQLRFKKSTLKDTNPSNTNSRVRVDI